MWTCFKQSLAATVDLLLPPACLLCNQVLSRKRIGRDFCFTCLACMLPLSSGHCRRCAQPFANTTDNHLCANCLRRPPAFSGVYALGIYQGALKDAIHKLKYHDRLTLAKPLGQGLAALVTADEESFRPDCVVPVPLHPRRLRRRGYNQAVEIARPLARALGTRVSPTLLQRVRETLPQQNLSATERRKNLRNAFALTAEPAGLKLLLVDDVMTTGETVRECSLTLAKGGAGEIRIAVVGRA